MGDNPDELVRKAHSKLTPGLLGKMFSSKESRQEEAAELLTSAANIYKIRKDWKKAGETYEEIARLELEQGGSTAYVHYQNAAHCFSFVDKVRSNQNLDAAIESCVKAGKYMQAGKTAQRIATECEENFDYPNAIDKYKKAAEYFAMESQNTKSMQQQCLLKVADLMCISNHKDMFTEAPKIYEKLGMQYLTVPLLKSSAKDMFFKNVMCYVAKKDEVTAEVNLKNIYWKIPHLMILEIVNSLRLLLNALQNLMMLKDLGKKFKVIKLLENWINGN